MPRILLVDDEAAVRRAVERLLSLQRGWEVASAATHDEAVDSIARRRPDLVLLDVSLPGMDGRQLLERLRRDPATSALPVIFLTGADSEADRVLGLKLGADDYVAKPFSGMELVARIEAVLRRSAAPAPAAPERRPLDAAGLSLDPAAGEASYRGHALRLQPKEFEILYLLASQPGRPLTRTYLLENSSSGLPASSRSLDTHIKNLRKKLGAGARLIETVPRRGYRFAQR